MHCPFSVFFLPSSFSSSVVAVALGVIVNFYAFYGRPGSVGLAESANPCGNYGWQYQWFASSIVQSSIPSRISQAFLSDPLGLSKVKKGLVKPH